MSRHIFEELLKSEHAGTDPLPFLAQHHLEVLAPLALRTVGSLTLYLSMGRGSVLCFDPTVTLIEERTISVSAIKAAWEAFLNLSNPAGETFNRCHTEYINVPGIPTTLRIMGGHELTGEQPTLFLAIRKLRVMTHEIVGKVRRFPYYPQVRDYFAWAAPHTLVVGPPGAGKSTFLAALVLDKVELYRANNVPLPATVMLETFELPMFPGSVPVPLAQGDIQSFRRLLVQFNAGEAIIGELSDLRSIQAWGCILDVMKTTATTAHGVMPYVITNLAQALGRKDLPVGLVIEQFRYGPRIFTRSVWIRHNGQYRPVVYWEGGKWVTTELLQYLEQQASFYASQYRP